MLAEDVRGVTQTSENLGVGRNGEPRKPGPWCGAAGPGRPKGRKNNALLAVEAFAREVVESEDYRESIRRRVKADTLHPSVETVLLYYAAGSKPTERVEVKDTTDEDFSGFTPEQVQERLLATARLVPKLIEEQVTH